MTSASNGPLGSRIETTTWRGSTEITALLRNAQRDLSSGRRASGLNVEGGPQAAGQEERVPCAPRPQLATFEEDLVGRHLNHLQPPEDTSVALDGIPGKPDNFVEDGSRGGLTCQPLNRIMWLTGSNKELINASRTTSDHRTRARAFG